MTVPCFVSSPVRSLRILLSLALVALAPAVQAQTVFFSEDFDGANPGANWAFMATQNSNAAGGPITNLTPNGPCNNYWIINSAHTPDSTNNRLGQRPKCNGFNSNFTFPNPDGGLNNNSLHITYDGSCALIAPGQTGQALTPPDSGDEYSYFNDPGAPNANANSDRWAMLTSPIDLSAAGNCGLRLEFDYYIGGDSLHQFTDRGVYLSNDGGTTWQEVENDIEYSANEWETFGDCKAWRSFSASLQFAGGGTNVLIAFRWRNQNPFPLESSNFSQASGFNIDNIRIVQSLAGAEASLQLGPRDWCKNNTVSGTVSFTQFPQGFDPDSFNYNWTISGPGTATFVNGTSSSDRTVSLQFNQNGSYTVDVVVTDPSTGCTEMFSAVVTISDCPPTANLNTDVTEVCATSPAPVGGAQTEVTTQDRSTSVPPITSHSWSATGPGSVTFTPNNTVANPQISFSTPGSYSITKQVTNAEGLTDDTTFTINAIDCQCNITGGGGLNQTIYAEDFETAPDSVSLNTQDLGTLPASSINPWIVNGILSCPPFVTTVAQPSVPDITNPVTNAGGGRYMHISAANTPFAVLFTETDGTCYDGTAGLNGAHFAHTDPIDATGFTNVQLSFYYLLGVTGAGQAYISTDNGSTWQLLKNLDQVPQWTKQTLTDPAMQNNTFLIGFWFDEATAGVNGDPPLAVDEILVTGDGGGGGGTDGVFTCPLASPLCPGDTIDVSYNAVGTFNAGNVFSIELSDATGNFASPTVLGTNSLSGNNPPTQVQSVVIPQATPPGTGYRIRVTASNADTNNFVDNGSDLEVLPQPGAGPIAGDSLLCVNTPGVIYTTPDSGFSLSWGIANGGDTSSNVIAPDTFRVNWGANPTAGTPDTVFVIASGACGEDTTKKPITLVAPDSLTPITGDSSICAPATGNYQVDLHTGSTYDWRTQAGTITTSPLDTNAIDIDWSGVPDGTYAVEVKETDLCGGVDSTQLFVQVTPTPSAPAINGPTTFCVNDTAVYAIGNPVQGVDYAWDVTSGPLAPAGGSLPQQGNSVSLETTGGGTATIQVIAFNGCGSDTATLDVDVTNNFDFNGISGPDTLCEPLATEAYNVPFIVGADYQWAITGGTIVGSDTSAGINVDWDPMAASRELTAEVTASCGSDTDTINVDVFPAQPNIALSGGADSACLGDTLSLSVTPALPANEVDYLWSVPPGWTIDAFNADSSQVSIITGNSSGTVSVDATTLCGTASLDTMITILQAPAMGPQLVSSGVDTLCPGESFDVSITNFDGNAFDYSWQVLSGPLSITSPAPDTNQTESFATSAGAGTGLILAEAANLCGADTDSIVVEIIDSLSIDAINGATLICPTANMQDYTAIVTPDNPDSTSYTWSVSGGASSITGSSTDTIVSIDWDVNAPTQLSLTLAVQRAGCVGDTLSLPADTLSNPGSASITGPVQVCVDPLSQVTYSVPDFGAGATYTWTVPDSFSLAMGQGTRQIAGTWDGAAASQTVQVDITTPQCGNGTVTLDVTANQVVLANCSATPNPVATGDTATISTNLSGGTAPYQVEVDFGDGSPLAMQNGVPNGPFSVDHEYINNSGTARTDTVTIIATGANGCVDSCSFELTVNAQQTLLLTNSVVNDSICANEPYAYGLSFSGFPAGTVGELQISADSFATDSTVVRSIAFDSVSSPFNESFDLPASIPPGSYMLRVSTGAPSFASSNMVPLEVLPVPQPGIGVQPGSQLVLPDQNTATFTSNGPTPNSAIAQFEWSFSDTSLIAAGPNETEVTRSFDQPGSVSAQLLVVDTNGCRDSVSTQITIEDDEGVFIPNVFTPNGDGINDDIVATVRGPVMEMQFVLLSRWGEDVLVRNLSGSIGPQVTIAEGNSGEISDMPTGSYIYHATFILDNGTEITRNGTITLLR